VPVARGTVTDRGGRAAAAVVAVVAALVVPVNAVLGAVLEMGTDSCSSAAPGGAFKCTAAGAAAIFLLPVGLAVAGAVLAVVGVAVRAVRVVVCVTALLLPVVGLVASFAIVA